MCPRGLVQVVAPSGAGSQPPSGVFEPVVVAAKRVEVFDQGRSALGVVDPMVQVRPGGGHPTPGEHTSGRPGFHIAALGGAGTTACGPVPHHRSAVRVSDSDPPPRSLLVGSHLAGHVGDHRAVAAQVSGSVGQLRQGGQVDPEVDDPTPAGTGAVVHQVQEDVGPQLIQVRGSSDPLAAKARWSRRW